MNTLCASDTDWTIFADGAPLEESDHNIFTTRVHTGDENRLLNCDRRDAYCLPNAADIFSNLSVLIPISCNLQVHSATIDGRPPDDG